MGLPKRRWSLAEKSLFLTPLILILCVGILKFGPDSARMLAGGPQTLTTSPENNLRFLRISGDGRIIAATGAAGGAKTDRTSGTIYLWDAATLTPLPSIAPAPYREANGYLSGHFTYGLCFSYDGGRMGLTRKAKDFTVLDLKTRLPQWSAKFWATQADFSPDGSLVAVSGDGKVALLDAANGHIIKVWPRSMRNSEDLVVWSPDSQLLASITSISGRDHSHIGHGGKIEIHDRRGRKLKEMGSSFTTAVNFSPDGQSLICVGENHRGIPFRYGESPKSCFVRNFALKSGVLNWERISNNDVFPFNDYRDAIYSPNGKTVAVHAVGAHQILLLDANTGNELSVLPIKFVKDTTMNLPHSLIFSADGKRLFARGKDSVLVWNLNS